MSEAGDAFDAAAQKRVGAELEKQWLKDNREAIAQYYRRVAERGLLSDEAGPP
jgi:post-segregation antitoxin (ccd killing protein)